MLYIICIYTLCTRVFNFETSRDRCFQTTMASIRPHHYSGHIVYNILYIIYILHFTTDGRAIHRKATNQTGCSGGNDVGWSALYHIMTRVYIYLIVLRYLRARSHCRHTHTRTHTQYKTYNIMSNNK